MTERNSPGFVGWEVNPKATVQMTLGSMNKAQTKNQRERFQHHRRLSKITDEEREFRDHNQRRIDAMKTELKEMEAYKKVYKKYSLSRIEANKEEVKESEDEDESKRSCQESNNCTQNTLPISPFWKIYSKNNINEGNKPESSGEPQKLKRPPGYLQPLKLKKKTPTLRRMSRYRKETRSLQSLDQLDLSENALKETKHSPTSERRLGPDRKVSSHKQDFSGYEILTNEIQKVNRSTNSLTEDDILHMTALSTNSMKRFLGKEAGKYLAANEQRAIRKRKIKKLLSKRTVPNFVERRRTTSSIFREYSNLKTQLQSENHNGASVDQYSMDDSKGSLKFVRNKAVLPSIRVNNSSNLDLDS